MQRFILFFRGGLTESQIQDRDKEIWTPWLNSLKQQGILLDSAFIAGGKIVSSNNQEITNFNFNLTESAHGFVIIKANNLDDIMSLTKGCPVFSYGGNVTIRPITEIN